MGKADVVRILWSLGTREAGELACWVQQAVAEDDAGFSIGSGTPDATFGYWHKAMSRAVQAQAQAQAQAPSPAVALLEQKVEEIALVAREAMAGQEELRMKLSKASMTTRSYKDIGQTVRDSLQHKDLSLAPVANSTMDKACKAALGAMAALNVDADPKQKRAALVFNDGTSLMDAVIAIYPTVKPLTEETHMQPLVRCVLQAIQECVLPGPGRDEEQQHIVDTHRSSKLSDPAAKPDFTVLAEPLQAWTQAVGTFELKLKAEDRHEMLGQLYQYSCAALDAQPSRHFTYGAGLHMNGIEIFEFRRQDKGPLKVTSSGDQAFTISSKSPGFQLLARLLATPKLQQGFIQPQGPSVQLPGFSVTKALLLRQGTVRDSSDNQRSFVYSAEVVKAAAGSGLPVQPKEAVLKLNQSTHEGDVLEQLQGVPHVVRLMTKGTCNFQGMHWHVVLLEPKVEHLDFGAELVLVAQVTCDVAWALEQAGRRGFLHRDVTPGNFGYEPNGRGTLLDFSAAIRCDLEQMFAAPDLPAGRPSSSPLAGITGTMLWAPLTVLWGCGHTMSSQLEGLFLSILYISMDGRRWPGRHEWQALSTRDWQHFRSQQFGQVDLLNDDLIAEQFRPLVKRLHEIFWPRVPSSRVRTYSTTVTVKQVLDACKEACKQVYGDASRLILPG